ncbi:hypothetical protein FEM48_Zijuj01G0265600 [Ziziphus jujuba var. spinosa]|uniref:(S)-2-hydroxy-acid oxidase n=1 Tax=Ziziphus jujuba var. spinosa TaxID=714518 RepID=A0A978W512_ZIZJJ|nr:hypothetical protein FEM48_Zijuj01G0265600 [Ziziphus jujuba var. spinosa]
MYYDFYTGGAEDEYTLKENGEAFQRIMIRPRILVDVSRIDMSITVLGYKISAPIMVAPTSMQQLAHPEGEVATTRAAAACNTIMILSCMSTSTVEEVASSCNAVRFFQLYVFKRRDISAQLVRRAEKGGFEAIVQTVYSPRLGRREADIKNKYISAFCLLVIATRSITFPFSTYDVPPLSARMAVEAGFDGIVVSNHGARQLDYTPATISVLEKVSISIHHA